LTRKLNKRRVGESNSGNERAQINFRFAQGAETSFLMPLVVCREGALEERYLGVVFKQYFRENCSSDNSTVPKDHMAGPRLEIC
jgi:hypothetical protein